MQINLIFLDKLALYNRLLMISPSAQVLESTILGYNIDYVEYIVRSRVVNHGVTGKPYLKYYYDMKPCALIITFYEYYFHRDDHEIITPIERFLESH
jgi:hypothetical protein